MQRISTGVAFPEVSVSTVGGGTVSLGREGAGDWHLVIVYRGKHCPICHKYLAEIQEKLAGFADINISVTTVSSDPEDRAQAFKDELGLTLPVGYGLTIEQMQTLGIYISRPGKSTDPEWNFSEPAAFLVDNNGILRVVELTNVPFVRPNAETLLNGLTFMRSADYPMRGTYPD